MKRIALTVIVGIALAAMGLGSFASSAEAGNWPQWRGPDGSGISNEKNLPSEWSPTKNIKWKTPIDGRAHSSPIVWGNKAFLTTAVAPKVYTRTTSKASSRGKRSSANSARLAWARARRQFFSTIS